MSLIPKGLYGATTPADACCEKYNTITGGDCQAKTEKNCALGARAAGLLNCIAQLPIFLSAFPSVFQQLQL
jgi:hypothetical protein